MRNTIPGKGPKRLIVMRRAKQGKKPQSGTFHSAANTDKPRWPVKGGHD